LNRKESENMLTSSFFSYRGPGRISIARGAPRSDPGYRIYRALAPGAWFKTVSPREFANLYFNEVLRPLDPKQVAAVLQRLAGDAEPVLLCWEKPPLPAVDRWWELQADALAEVDISNFCHRRMTAAWLSDALGIEVKEWAAPAPSTEPRQASIF
jgi:hypothetical protein